jgi:precorrin-3B synthase
MTFQRRGACPSLSAPMSTGDGLLVRINPLDGALTPAQLAAIAQAAARFGNGLLEITSRGSLQIRGLTDATVAPFSKAISALDIGTGSGIGVRTGPLAGVDALEITDPRPVAEKLRRAIAARGFAGQVAPKISITVDGGGVLNLSAIPADVRIEAVAMPRGTSWGVRIGGNSVLGQGDENSALQAALDALALLVEPTRRRRGRDLTSGELAKLGALLLQPQGMFEARGETIKPVGIFPLKDGSVAHGFALGFGQIGSEALTRFVAALDPAREIRLAPDYGFLVLGLPETESTHLSEIADECGLVARGDDPRLRIVTCAGAPACASAYLRTKAIAKTVIAERPDLLTEIPTLHVSGCGKQCSKPNGPVVSVIGVAGGSEVETEGVGVNDDLRGFLARLAAAHMTSVAGYPV